MKTVVCVIAMLVSLVLADWPRSAMKRAYRDDFPSWAALFGEEDDQYHGYRWDVFSAMTQDDNGDDEWELNFFQIKAAKYRTEHKEDKADDLEDWQVLELNKDILMMHGQGQDAEKWMTGYFVGTPLPLMLADQGYTVYMANNRGTKFSKNLQHDDDASEAYWDFDFTDMGTKDLPAVIHSIRSINEANNATYVLELLEGGRTLPPRRFADNDTLTYIGYGMGNMQMFYGLTQLEDFFFNETLSSFIALAPCVLPTNQATTSLDYVNSVGAYRGLGIYAVNGPNWTADLEKICTQLSQYACNEAKEIAEQANGVPISVKNLEYLRQLAITQRYQVYVSNDIFNQQNEQQLIQAETSLAFQPPVETSSRMLQEIDVTEEEVVEIFATEPVALHAIDRVNITLLVAAEDKSCSLDQAKWIESYINTTQQLRSYENAGHDFFTWSNQKRFFDNLMSNVEGSESGALALLSSSVLTITTLVFGLTS